MADDRDDDERALSDNIIGERCKECSAATELRVRASSISCAYARSYRVFRLPKREICTYLLRGEGLGKEEALPVRAAECAELLLLLSRFDPLRGHVPGLRVWQA